MKSKEAWFYRFARRLAESLSSIALMMFAESKRLATFSAWTYLNRIASSRALSVSDADPRAMSQNLANSAFEFLPHPSATFRVIDEAALRSCRVSPNCSLAGKPVVT